MCVCQSQKWRHSGSFRHTDVGAGADISPPAWSPQRLAHESLMTRSECVVSNLRLPVDYWSPALFLVCRSPPLLSHDSRGVGTRPFITHESRRADVLHPNLEIRGNRCLQRLRFMSGSIRTRSQVINTVWFWWNMEGLVSSFWAFFKLHWLDSRRRHKRKKSSHKASN